MITRIEGRCQYEDCEEPATYIASGRKRYGEDNGHPNPGVYCDAHANVVEDEGNPEYRDTCPNCGCRFGVN